MPSKNFFSTSTELIIYNFESMLEKVCSTVNIVKIFPILFFRFVKSLVIFPYIFF